MLKKLLQIFIFFNIFLTISYSEDVILTKIENIDIKGNSYFPLFIGAKWTWTLEMFGTKSIFNWEIIECYEITDPKNNLNKVIAFKTICKEINSEWFFIEYDNFICFYEKIDNNYQIQKLIPINPKIGDKWSENSNINIVSTITDEFIKVDTETEDKKKIGYKIFRKNIGLYDLYEIEKKDNETIYTKWTLNEFNKNEIKKQDEDIVIKNSDETYIENEISEKKKINTNEKIENEINKETENYLIKDLKNDKSYIQIGAFSILNNVIPILNKSKEYNYNVFIYLDKDNLYKLLIEIDKDEDSNLNFIKNNIEEKAFLKQKRKR